MSLEESVTPCTICGTATIMLGTKLCDNCYEVLSRIRGMDTEHIVKILERANKAGAVGYMLD